MNDAGFDSPGIIGPDEIPKEHRPQAKAIAGNDGLAEIINPHDDAVAIGDGTSIEGVIGAEGIVAFPGCTGIEKTNELEVAQEIGSDAPGEHQEYRQAQFGIDEHIGIAISDIGIKAAKRAGEALEGYRGTGVGDRYGIVELGKEPVVDAAQIIQEALGAKGYGAGGPERQDGEFTQALVVAGIEAGYPQEAAIKLEAGSIAEVDIKGFIEIGEKFIAGSVEDIGSHAEGIIEDVFQFEPDPLFSARGCIQGIEICSEGGQLILSEGSRSPQAGKNIEGIAEAVLAQDGGEHFSVGEESGTGGHPVVAQVDGISLVEAVSPIVEGSKIFSTVEVGRQAHTAFEFVVFE